MKNLTKPGHERIVELIGMAAEQTKPARTGTHTAGLPERMFVDSLGRPKDEHGYLIPPSDELRAEVARRYNAHHDLLEACKAAMGISTGGGAIEKNQRIFNKLRAAIAKAQP